jgi:hypothetical protein
MQLKSSQCRSLLEITPLADMPDPLGTLLA